MSRCLYSSGIKRFLSLDDNLIFGTLCDKYHGDAPTTTREAWKGEISNYEFCPADEEILKKIIEIRG